MMWTDVSLAAIAWLLTYLLHSTVLTATVGLVSRFTHRGSPALRENLWKLALAGALLTASLQTAAGVEPLGGSFTLGEQDVTTVGAQMTPGWQRAAADPENVAGDPDIPSASATGPGATARPERVSQPGPLAGEAAAPPVDASPGRAGLPHAVPSFLAPVLAAVRGTGAGILVALFLSVGLARVVLFLVGRREAIRRLEPRESVADRALLATVDDLRQQARLRPMVRLTSSSGTESPLALEGSEICLPVRALNGLRPERVRGMIAHEVAHVARRDPGWLLFFGLVEAFFFVQPLHRLARRRWQEAAEFVCDDWAAGRLGRGRDVALSLVQVAGWLESAARPSAAPLVGMADGRSPLLRRIERLLDARLRHGRPESRRARTVRTAVPAVLMAAVLLLAPGFLPRAHLPESEAFVGQKPSRSSHHTRSRSYSTTMSYDTKTGSVSGIAVAPGAIAIAPGGISAAPRAVAVAPGAVAVAPVRVGGIGSHSRVFAYSNDGSGSCIVRSLNRGDDPLVIVSGRLSTLLAIGADLSTADDGLAAQFGLPEGEGILVEDVDEDGPAAEAGLERYDLITRIDGKAATMGMLADRLKDAKAGEKIEFAVLRRAEPAKVTLTVTEEMKEARSLLDDGLLGLEPGIHLLSGKMEELEKALQQLDVSRLRFEDQREARDLARELHRQEQQIRDEVGVELERIRRKVDRSTL